MTQPEEAGGIGDRLREITSERGDSMGMVHEFVNSNRQCRRWELDGQPLEVITKEITTPYRGTDYPTVVSIWKGLHKLDDGRKIWLVDKSATFDAGPKLGVTLTFSEHPEVSPTEEERRANRANLNAVIGQILPGFQLLDSPA